MKRPKTNRTTTPLSKAEIALLRELLRDSGLAARLDDVPRSPARPWTGRPAEFEEAEECDRSPRASPRTARALGEARARHPRVWRIRVDLVGIRPPIWRRLVVPASATLHDLHIALQHAMGWTMTHLYEFEASGLRFMEPDPEGDDVGPVAHDSRIVILGELGLEVGDRFRYRYDFGDGWDHAIHVEGIGEYDLAQPVPMCLGGERACPPEDVGGVSGYEDLVRAMASPRHKRRGEFMEWLGRPFDSESFEPGWANVSLKGEQALWRRRMGGNRATRR